MKTYLVTPLELMKRQSTNQKVIQMLRDQDIFDYEITLSGLYFQCEEKPYLGKIACQETPWKHLNIVGH